MEQKINLLNHLGIMGYSAAISIKVGLLYIKPNNLQKHLGRYAHRFVSYTDDEIYEFQHLGTATGICYRNRLFLVSTNHQRKLGQDGKLGIVCDPGHSVITPSTMWTVNVPNELSREDNHDFCLFEFEPEKYPHRSLASQFFPVISESGIGDNIGKLALSIGYPTRLQNVDYYNGQVDLLAVSSFVKLIEQTTTSDIYTFKTVSEDRFIEDGMSGAPLFEVINDDDGFQTKWLGFVVRGGNKSRLGRVISGKYITNRIDQIIDN